MNSFEREGKPTVYIQKVMKSGQGFEVTVQEGSQTKVIRGYDVPRQDLYNALDALDAMLTARLSAIDTRGYAERIIPLGISYDDEGDGSYRIHAEIQLDRLGAKVKFRTGKMYLADPDFWEVEGGDGTQLHLPQDYPKKLTPDEEDIIDNLLLESFRYAYEGKHSDNGQLELPLDGEGTAEEDQDIEEDEEDIF